MRPDEIKSFINVYESAFLQLVESLETVSRMALQRLEGVYMKDVC